MPKSDTAVAAFGRFNPPTKGHLKLVNKLTSIPGDHYLFLSHTQDAEKNPLDYDTKVSYAKKFFEGVHIGDKGCDTIYDVLNKIKDMGYDHLVYVCGEDEYEPFGKIINEYNENNKAFESVKIVQAGDREEDSEGTDGISATKVRELAKDGDYEDFCNSIPDRKYAKGLYNDLRLAMKLDEDILDEIEPNDIDKADARAVSGPINKKILDVLEPIPSVPYVTKYPAGLYKEPKGPTISLYVHNGADLVAVLNLDPKNPKIANSPFEIMIVEYMVVGTRYQGKNIGFTLYKDIITKANYNLGAYLSQSDGARILWKKLFDDPEISMYASNDFSNKRGNVEVYPVVIGPNGDLAAKVNGKVVSLYGWGNTMGIIATAKGGALDQKILSINENAALDRTLATKSKASGIPRGILRQVYNRGMAAWVTGHRPGASQQAWGMDRVNSFIVKGETWHTTDSDLAKKVRSEQVDEAHVFKYIYWGWIDPNGKIYDKPKSTHTIHAEYVRDILIDISNPNDATDNFDHTDSYGMSQYKAFNRGWVRFFLTPEYEMYFSVYLRGFKLSPTISTAIKQVLDRAHKLTKRLIFQSYNFENIIDRPLNAIEVADPDEFLKKLRNKYRGVSEMNEAHIFDYPYWGWISPVGEVFLPTRKDEGLHDHIIQHVTDGKIKSAERGMNIGWVRFFIELDDNSMHFETINIDKVNFSKVSSKIKSIVNSHFNCSAFNFEWLPSTPPAYAKKRHIEEDDPTIFIKKVSNVLRINEHIEHSKNGWTLFSKKTHKRLGGPYSSKEQAIKRERQVAYFKHMGETNIKTFKQFSEEEDALDVTPKADQEVLLEVTAPKEVKDNVTDGLDLRKQFNRGGNSDTIKTANKLLKEPFDESDLKNLLVKLARHEKEKKTGWDDPEEPSNGFIAWMLLGGDAGKLWAEKSLSSTGKSIVKEESLNEVSPEGLAAMRRMGMQQDHEGERARENYERITRTKWSPPEATDKKQPTPETSKTESELSLFLSKNLGFEYKKEEIIPGRPGMIRYEYSNSGKVYKEVSGWTLRVYYRRMRQNTSQPIGVTGWYLFSPDSKIEEFDSGKTMEKLISVVQELKRHHDPNPK